MVEEKEEKYMELFKKGIFDEIEKFFMVKDIKIFGVKVV